MSNKAKLIYEGKWSSNSMNETEFELELNIFDLNNTSPSIRLPSNWEIAKGCKQQLLDLNPFDQDGDIIRCRWAVEDSIPFKLDSLFS